MTFAFILLPFLLLIPILLYLIFKVEKFNIGRGIEPAKQNLAFQPEKEYIRTLGDWGKLSPQFCFETTPAKDVLNSENENKVCNACHLVCSSKNAYDRCEKCLKLL
uniref:Uncharacterized protein n=1 Tax=viral metagenome TaxID=1070528 RepID=A0A6C0KSN2_9ZZZZ